VEIDMRLTAAWEEIVSENSIERDKGGRKDVS
jgi:hypothetical protein